MAKITKADIKEALDNIPIDNLLLPKATEKKFTPKQRAFAKKIALGKSKSQAYRETYNTKAKPSVIATDAGKLGNRPDIVLLTQAYEEAIEASKYRTPAQLRELVIHQLTKTAISEDVSVRDRLTAIKMLGTVSEVSAFTERKESLVIHESSKVKQQLLDQLKTIVSGDIKEVASDIDEGEELLAQLSGARGSKHDDQDTYPLGDTPNIADSSGKPMHNIPHTESLSDLTTTESLSDLAVESSSEVVTGFLPSEDFEEGVGVVKKGEVDGDVEYREGPLMEKGTPESGEGV